MQQVFASLIFVIAGAFIIGAQAFFTVDETEQAILLQLGEPVGEGQDLIKKPGLHFKIPFVQQVRTFDGRILSVDPRPERVNISSDARERNGEKVEETASGEPILVDTFARYRITDPLAFMKTLQTIRSAESRITGIMTNATRDVLGKATLSDLLSDRRTALMQEIDDKVSSAMKDGGFGVEIVDIRIVRADLTDKLRTSTVNRMITERRELATETRAKGREQALEIRSKAEKERTVLLANARRDSQIIRGEGDRIAIQTYANAFNADPDFYSFLRSMEAYENTLADDQTQMILSPDSAFLKFIRSQSGN